MTQMFRNQLINYLSTGYPARTENTEPSVTLHGSHYVRSVLSDFGLRIFQLQAKSKTQGGNIPPPPPPFPEVLIRLSDICL